ncbi:MazG nucleotide pyrophosphohydrolase domain-containing protein [Candidatus Poriferisodalis sp.]|uniref:MazG nucleotide pyrophosphohydrolase domain-containing protein n=1 Tax=Candidatus Poriferisodalis sp. TaxID=3101277 RepID=UPI003B02E79C
MAAEQAVDVAGPATEPAELGQSELGQSELGQHELGRRLVSLHRVIATLRRECPWDRVQTHASLAPYALDEAAELAEALQAAHDALSSEPNQTVAATATEDLVEELGDVLLQVLMNAAIGEQAGTFTLVEVLETVEAKMVRRHPHVFRRDPSAPVPTDAELSVQWEEIKAAEREARSHRIAAREARDSQTASPSG